MHSSHSIIMGMTGDNFVCRSACLPGQHEGPLGASGSQGQVLRACHQSHAAFDWSFVRQADICEGDGLSTKQVTDIHAACTVCLYIFPL